MKAAAVAAAEPIESPDRDRYPYRMRDLVAETGIPRQVIHFYIQSGLVPEGHKTGRNMAYYGREHVDRIMLVRRLQHERFLPLKAIRAIFDETEHTFSPEQRRLLSDVKARLAQTLAAPHAEGPAVLAAPVLARVGVSASDLAELAEIGVLAVVEGPDGQPRIAESDVWVVEMFAQMRAAGFSPELGFAARDVAIFEEAISTLFKREIELIATRMSGVTPEQLAQMLERSLPLINAFLARYHTTKVRHFFAAM